MKAHYHKRKNEIQGNILISYIRKCHSFKTDTFTSNF
uniref:Uncharacterized protein n=1 Tax=Rhizophora mucronata TaxID=61149 RepID=A0A2P2JDR2_RHIMU